MKRLSCLILLSLVLEISCQEDNEFAYGLIQTGEVTDVDADGATFHARVSDAGRQPILEYGFVWDSKQNPVLESAEKLIVREPASTGIIHQRISTTLQKDIQYYVRAYIRNKSFVTYGKEVTFKGMGSAAPLITSFTPASGNLKDTLVIVGRNFSYRRASNEVYLGAFRANVLKAVQDTLWVVVPDDLNQPHVQVSASINGSAVKSEESFSLVAPVITDFSAKTGTFGGQVSITGDRYLSSRSSLKVFLDNVQAEILEATNQRITVKVPDALNKRRSEIRVTMNNLTASSAETFLLAPMSLTDFSPKVIKTGQLLTLSGANFSPSPTNNIVKVGGLQAQVVSASTNSLQVIVPLQNTGIYPARDVTVSVDVAEENLSYQPTLLINDQWFRMPDFPGTALYELQAFVAGDKAYIGLNNTNEFWRFDPATRQWERLADFAGVKRLNGAGFYLDGNIYFGTGWEGGTNYDDFWQYTIATDSWTKKNDFNGSARTGASGFSIGNKGYITSGLYSEAAIYNHPYADCWMYDPASDTWLQTADYDHLEWGGVDGMANGIAVAVGGVAYYGIGLSAVQGDYEHRVFRYDPTLAAPDQWQRLANFPASRNYYKGIGFVLGGVPYFKTINAPFYYYNENYNSWESVETNILSDVRAGVGFSVGNKGYVGLGYSKAMWEYDPSR